MKILATSDLHGDFETLKKLVDVVRDYDAVIIAGDFTNFSSARVARHMLSELESHAKKLFIVPGNCDLEETSELYTELGISLHGSGKIVDGIGFFGAGGSNITPFNTPLEYADDDIKGMLEEGYEKIKRAKIKILVSHSPPKGTLDQTSGGINAGSEAVRDFLNENKVSLVICGHIHEAKGVGKVGAAEVVNTGPASYGFVSVCVDGDDKVSIEFLEI
jgi:Icc-related predicted phosphoesterase